MSAFAINAKKKNTMVNERFFFMMADWTCMYDWNIGCEQSNNYLFSNPIPCNECLLIKGSPACASIWGIVKYNCHLKFWNIVQEFVQCFMEIVFAWWIAEKHIIQINFIVFQHFIDKQPARSNKMWHVTDCILNGLQTKPNRQKQKWVLKFQQKTILLKSIFRILGWFRKPNATIMCVKGWDQYVKGSLLKLITEGKGQLQVKNKKQFQN